MSAPTFPGGRRWRPIPNREIEVGLIVSIRGITSRASAIVHVQAVEVDRRRGQVNVAGRQPYGGGWRYLERTLDPDGTSHLLVDENGNPA